MCMHAAALSLWAHPRHAREAPPAANGAKAVKASTASLLQAAGGSTLNATLDATIIALPTSTNELVTSDVQTLFIPIWASQPDGSPCPNTQLPTYTKANLLQLYFAAYGGGQPTLESVYRTVSYNQTTMTPRTSYVTDFARIGCSGVE